MRRTFPAAAAVGRCAAPTPSVRCIATVPSAGTATTVTTYALTVPTVRSHGSPYIAARWLRTQLALCCCGLTGSRRAPRRRLRVLYGPNAWLVRPVHVPHRLGHGYRRFAPEHVRRVLPGRRSAGAVPARGVEPAQRSLREQARGMGGRSAVDRGHVWAVLSPACHHGCASGHLYHTQETWRVRPRTVAGTVAGGNLLLHQRRVSRNDLEIAPLRRGPRRIAAVLWDTVPTGGVALVLCLLPGLPDARSPQDLRLCEPGLLSVQYSTVQYSTKTSLRQESGFSH